MGDSNAGTSPARSAHLPCGSRCPRSAICPDCAKTVDAPATSTNESATCATTSARRKLNRSRPAVIPRPPAFITAPGSIRVPRIAGASPNRRQVRTASPTAKPSTRQSGAQIEKDRVGTCAEKCDEEPAQRLRQHCTKHGAYRGQQQTLDQQLANEPSARGPKRLTHGDLAFARARSREQQIGEVGAGDQQNQPPNRQQQPERPLVFFAQLGNT